MSKHWMSVAAVLSMSLGISAWAADHSKHHHQGKDDQAATTRATGHKYVCPMKDSPASDKPGVCPKCGMKMVEQKDEGAKTQHSEHHED